MKSIAFLLLAMGAFSLCGCAPTTKAPEASVSHVKAPPAIFTASAVLHLENLTIDEYALLNRNMDDLLKRVGLLDCRGYLIPIPGLHGAIQPQLVVHASSDSKITSNPDLDSLVKRFSIECEKDLYRWREAQQKPNQVPEPTSGLAPGLGSS